MSQVGGRQNATWWFLRVWEMGDGWRWWQMSPRWDSIRWVSLRKIGRESQFSSSSSLSRVERISVDSTWESSLRFCRWGWGMKGEGRGMSRWWQRLRGCDDGWQCWLPRGGRSMTFVSLLTVLGWVSESCSVEACSFESCPRGGEATRKA